MGGEAKRYLYCDHMGSVTFGSGETTMHMFAARLALSVSAALLALCMILTSEPAAAQAVAPAASGAPANEQIIITNVPRHSSRVREFLKRLFGRASAAKAKLEVTGSEVWTVPKGKLAGVEKRLKRLGSKVIRLRENWNHILRRSKEPVAMTAAQRAAVNKMSKSPETVNLGMFSMPDPALVELALNGEQKTQEQFARVIIPVSDDESVTIVRTRPTDKTDKGFTWSGEVEGTGERAVLMLWRDGHLSGYFGHKGRVFTVNHVRGQVHTMAEIDPGRLPADHAPTLQRRSLKRLNGEGKELSQLPSVPPEPTVAPFPTAERRALEAKKVTINLMLLYTKNAASHYVRDPGDLLALAVEQANDSFRNSGLVNISLRLVHAQEIDYNEASAQQFEHLYRMVDGVGPFRDVKKLRYEKRADIVGLIVDDPTGCGLSTRVGADAQEAYFVVHHACAAITYSIAHEVGHILGARHDRVVDANTMPFAFGHGYINGTKWRDMMSYQEGCGGCPRIPYWSNPRIKYRGEPTGTAASDNARVILQEAERVSRYRDQLVQW
jgi:hypothetical protein